MDIRRLLICILIGLILGGVLACNRADTKIMPVEVIRDEALPSTRLYIDDPASYTMARFIDPEYNVVCYLTFYGRSISCVPLTVEVQGW